MKETRGNIASHNIADSFYALADAWAVADASEGALPVESVHRAWTEDPAVHLPFAHATGHLGGDSALHMSSILKTLGIKTEQLGNLQPDHLAVELNVAGILAEASPSTLDQFLEDRLGWIDDLENDALAQGEAHSGASSRTSLIHDTCRCIHAAHDQLANADTWQGRMPVSLSF